MSRSFLSAFVLVSATFYSGGTAVASSSIELSELLNTFLLPPNSDYLGWSVGATSGFPIEWKTSGIVDGTECHVEEPFCRLGAAVVTVNSKVTHTVLAQTVQPGKWLITLSGARAGVSKVSIESDVSSQELDEVDIPFILEKSKMKLTPTKCLDEPASFGNVLYQVTAPNKKPAWLLNTWSCGSGGCSRDIDIYYHLQDIQKVECAGDSYK